MVGVINNLKLLYILYQHVRGEQHVIICPKFAICSVMGLTTRKLTEMKHIGANETGNIVNIAFRKCVRSKVV